tara:strand:+ start:437 stop:856 length:420 start_codon:yes stop_codon:yes gene_type:complete
VENFASTEYRRLKLKRLVEESRSLMTLRRSIKLATEFLGSDPPRWDKTRLGVQMKFIWTGLVWENTVKDQRGLPDIAKSLGLTTHSTVFFWKAGWHDMDWGQRHGFLILFEEAKKKPRKFCEIYRSMQWLDEEYKYAGI